MEGRATINEGGDERGGKGGSRYLVIKFETAVWARKREVISSGRGRGGVRGRGHGREGGRWGAY